MIDDSEQEFSCQDLLNRVIATLKSTQLLQKNLMQNPQFITYFTSAVHRGMSPTLLTLQHQQEELSRYSEQFLTPSYSAKISRRSSS